MTFARRVADTANPVNFVQSNSNAVTVNSTTPTTIASVSITTKGGSVLLLGHGDMNPTTGGDWNYYTFYRDSTQIGKIQIGQTSAASSNLPFALHYVDTPAAGTYTYSIKAYNGVGSILYGEQGSIQAPTIIAMELFNA